MKTNLTSYTLVVFKSTLKFKLLFFFLLVNTVFAFAQTCNAKINVIKNRNIRSTTNEGTYYKMSITNNGSNNDEYSLSSYIINTNCENKDGSSSAKNVVLNVSFEDNNFKPITEIIIHPGKTLTFLAHITVPINTPLERWCCAQITATSKACPSYKISATLHTLVINSNDN